MAQQGMRAALHSAGHVVQHRGVSLDRWVDFRGFGEGARQGVIFARAGRHYLAGGVYIERHRTVLHDRIGRS